VSIHGDNYHKGAPLLLFIPVYSGDRPLFAITLPDLLRSILFPNSFRAIALGNMDDYHKIV
jgi:hypothetical protein